LRKLLAERKEKKKLMEAEKDPIKKMVYNSQQEGLKIIANSIYGQTGSHTSLIGCFEIADSTTSYGRNNIRRGIYYIENQLK
jgi:DNA polymerase delta subunit 1